MGFRSWLLITALIIILTVAVIMLALPHFKPMNHAVTSTANGVSFIVANVSVNVPIYVVGSSLVNKLAALGINESLIRPVTISQLPLLPNGSVVIVDWPSIRPSLIVNDTGGVVTVNLTSPIIRYLADSIARGDIVGIYANGSVEGVVDFILAYSWAVASGSRLIANGGPIGYLVAYPTIPVNTHEAVVYIAKWIKPRGIVIGPVYLSQLTTVVANMMRLIIVSNSVDPLQGEDPCYEAYYNYGIINNYFNSNPEPGMYVANTFTFIWATPMFTNAEYPTGIIGYQDGNGTYLWDTCLLIGNTAAYLANNPSGVLYYLPADVIGYEEYQESSTMYNNNGFEGYQVGAIDYCTSDAWYNESYTNALVADPVGATFNPNSWNPPPTSSMFSYEIQGVIPFIGVGITLPSGASESISGSTNPWDEIQLPPGVAVLVPNITWTFNIGMSANNAGFPNAFEDTTPAMVVLPSLSTTSTAAFPVDFENHAVTSQFACAYYTDQAIWVNALWVINIVPQSSSTVNLTQSYPSIYLSNAPPNTYITGVSSSTIYTPCPVSG